jgi:5-methylcytosine-specific restriction enzyme subunit McrC
MELKQVREYQWIGNGESASLSEQQLKVFDSIAAKLPSRCIEWQRDRFRFRGYCGVFTLDNLTIEVLPKIHGTESAPGRARELLVRMISAVHGFQLSQTATALLSLQRYTFLDVFILFFAESLEALVRRCMQHAYVSREANLRSLRGKILVSHQVKFNSLNSSHIYCAYDEFSADNPLNRIIKATLTYISRVVRSHEIRSRIEQLAAMFADVSYEFPSEATWRNIFYDRTTEHWREIINQCRWFLSGLSPDVISGSERSAGLLFDMAKLFEKYIGIELKRALAEEFDVVVQGKQEYLLHRPADQTPLFVMKPDIYLQPRKSGLQPAILDMKWKLLDSESKKMGVSEADVYQVYTYANSYRVSNVGLLYPRQDALDPNGQILHFKEGQKALHVVVINLEELHGGRVQFRRHLRDILLPRL